MAVVGLIHDFLGMEKREHTTDGVLIGGRPRPGGKVTVIPWLRAHGRPWCFFPLLSRTYSVGPVKHLLSDMIIS